MIRQKHRYRNWENRKCKVETCHLVGDILFPTMHLSREQGLMRRRRKTKTQGGRDTSVADVQPTTMWKWSMRPIRGTHSTPQCSVHASAYARALLRQHQPV